MKGWGDEGRDALQRRLYVRKEGRNIAKRRAENSRNPYSDKMSYRAWTAYKAEEETELSLSEGDIVMIIDQSDDDW